MSTTVDTSHESMILTIDEAAAYLAIPKATLYTWRTRRAGFGPRAVTSGCHRTVRAAAAGLALELVLTNNTWLRIPDPTVVTWPGGHRRPRGRRDAGEREAA